MEELIEYLILQNIRTEAMLRALMVEFAEIKARQNNAKFEDELAEVHKSFDKAFKSVIEISPNAAIFAKAVMDNINLKDDILGSGK